MRLFLESLLLHDLRISYSSSRIQQSVTRTRLFGHRPTRAITNCTAAAVNQHRHNSPQYRPLHSTSAVHKKGGSGSNKSSKKQQTSSDDDDEPSSSTSQDSPVNPSDFTELKSSISKVHENLKETLSKLRAGGRFNPELVENLRVSIDKNNPKDTVRLADITQVLPKGRQLVFIVGDKAYVKPLTSALAASSLNLSPPQPSPNDPLHLTATLPTTTAESRKETVKQAQEYAEKAQSSIRNARGIQQKKLRDIQNKKTARPDDVRKASTGMEKVVSDASAEVKKIFETAKKVLEGT